MNQHRVFFALPCSDGEIDRLQQWRARHLERFKPRWVPRPNLHLTLAFIGSVSEAQLQQLVAIGEDIRVPPFPMRLDRLGQWGHGRFIWLAPTDIPDPLLDLVDELKVRIARQKLPVDERPFKPHVTLARGGRDSGLPEVTPDIELHADRLVLYQSETGPQGVRYRPVKTWPLESS